MIKFQVGFPDSQRERAAAIYDSAFETKLRAAIPDKRRRRTLLAEGIVPARAIAAMDKEEIVGLAGFHHRGTSFTGGITAKMIVGQTGFAGAIRALAVFALYRRKPQAGELLMDGVAVAAARRGQGIGSRLLQTLSAYAAANNYRRIRLDVINTNPGARRLYEREGFIAAAVEEFPRLEKLLGFSSSATMIKQVGRSVN